MNSRRFAGIGAGAAAFLLAVIVGLPMLFGQTRVPTAAPEPPAAPEPTTEPTTEPESPPPEETAGAEPKEPGAEQPGSNPYAVPPETLPTLPVSTTPDPDPDPTPTPDPDPTPDPEPTGPLTSVSLTFDDGLASHTLAAQILDEHGLDGTFYVNSGTVGLGGQLSPAALAALAASGHEIGGHSVTHPDLVTLPADEVTRQICDDRARLLEWGFPVRSFAYPFASASDEVKAIVGFCGYNSGRMLGDIRSPFSCAHCDAAETVPPSDPLYTRAPDQFESNWTLQDLQDAVTGAEATGGWLQLTFHDVCTVSCGELGINATLFDQFLDWLVNRPAVNTVVRTVGDVVGGPVAPPVTAPAVPPPAPAGANGIVNPGLEQVSGGVPVCWFWAPWGVNSPALELTTEAHSGSVASRIVMNGYESGDAKILPTFDLGACAPSVAAGESYSMRAWYTSTAVTQFAVYLRTVGGGWVYWTSSPWFAATDLFTEAEWTTGPIPAGFNGISFGLNIFSDGVLVTDDYALYNSVGAPPVAPPPVAVAPFAIEPPAEEALASTNESGVAEPPAEEPLSEHPDGEPPTEEEGTEPPAGDPPADDPPAVEPPADLEPAAPSAETAVPDAPLAEPAAEPSAPGSADPTDQ